MMFSVKGFKLKVNDLGFVVYGVGLQLNVNGFMLSLYAATMM